MTPARMATTATLMCSHPWSRDSKGISKLPQIQLILPYKVSCIKGSSEIPLNIPAQAECFCSVILKTLSR